MRNVLVGRAVTLVVITIVIFSFYSTSGKEVDTEQCPEGFHKSESGDCVHAVKRLKRQVFDTSSFPCKEEGYEFINGRCRLVLGCNNQNCTDPEKACPRPGYKQNPAGGCIELFETSCVSEFSSPRKDHCPWGSWSLGGNCTKVNVTKPADVLPLSCPEGYMKDTAGLCKLDYTPGNDIGEHSCPPGCSGNIRKGCKLKYFACLINATSIESCPEEFTPDEEGNCRLPIETTFSVYPLDAPCPTGCIRDNDSNNCRSIFSTGSGVTSEFVWWTTTTPPPRTQPTSTTLKYWDDDKDFPDDRRKRSI